MSPSQQLRVVCAAIVKDGRYLITQRQATSTFPLLWEFPGGRVKQGQSDAQALALALQSRLNIDVELQEEMGVTEHPFAAHTVYLALVRCRLKEKMPQARRVRAFAWVDSAHFADYEFVPTDQSAMSLLLPLGQART